MNPVYLSLHRKLLQISCQYLQKPHHLEVVLDMAATKHLTSKQQKIANNCINITDSVVGSLAIIPRARSNNRLCPLYIVSHALMVIHCDFKYMKTKRPYTTKLMVHMSRWTCAKRRVKKWQHYFYCIL